MTVFFLALKMAKTFNAKINSTCKNSKPKTCQVPLKDCFKKAKCKNLMHLKNHNA